MLNSYAAGDGGGGAGVVAREHIDRESERLEPLHGALARGFHRVRSRHERGERTVQRDIHERFPGAGERGGVRAGAREIHAGFRHELCVAREHAPAGNDGVYAAPRNRAELRAIGCSEPRSAEAASARIAFSGSAV